jgi:hypothetical protein
LKRINSILKDIDRSIAKTFRLSTTVAAPEALRYARVSEPLEEMALPLLGIYLQRVALGGTTVGMRRCAVFPTLADLSRRATRHNMDPPLPLQN